MQYRIVLYPQTGLSASDLVAAWNAGQYAEDARAVVDIKFWASFLPINITVALITSVVSIPTTVIATFISDYLNKFLEKDSPKVTVTTINTPWGEPVWIIK